MHIAKQQNDMITRFVKLASRIMDADTDMYKRHLYDQSGQKIPLDEFLRSKVPDYMELLSAQYGASFQCEDLAQYEAHHKTRELLLQQQSAFKTHSEDLLSEMKDRIEELSGLKTSAESTAQNVSASY